jgi:sterol desaturase/sphingolipid hydroxylase (fatty acid hydroxylase superfamily)
MNVTTNVRHYWTETMLYALAIYLPMAILFRLPPVTVYAIAIGSASWGFFIHSNLRIELGGGSWVAGAPQVHRIHHSRLPEHADKNFAAYFPIWDVLFGTYWHPRKGEFPPTGLHSGERIESIWLLLVWPLKLWLKRVLERLPRCTPSGQ